MISILKITKGNNSAKNVGGATVFNSARRLVVLYISTKFCDIIWPFNHATMGLTPNGMSNQFLQSSRQGNPHLLGPEPDKEITGDL